MLLAQPCLFLATQSQHVRTEALTWGSGAGIVGADAETRQQQSRLTSLAAMKAFDHCLRGVWVGGLAHATRQAGRRLHCAVFARVLNVWFVSYEAVC